jgi:hypothetical protein
LKYAKKPGEVNPAARLNPVGAEPRSFFCYGNPGPMIGSQAELEARRRGRRVAIAVYYLVIGTFIAVAAGEIGWQVFAPALSARATGSCKAGLRELAAAIDRARDAASSTPEGGEDAALARYRSALQPEWSRRDAIAASCRSSRQLTDALDAIERLRYAEEHAVRLEASELAPLRLEVRELMANRLDSMREAPDHR